MELKAIFRKKKSNLSVHQQMIRLRTCIVYMAWNITQSLKTMKCVDGPREYYAQ